MNEYEQRLIEVALEERFGGSEAAPRELAPQLRWSIERARHHQSRIALVPPDAAPERRAWREGAIGVAVGACLALFAALSWSDSTRRTIPVDLRLLHGSVRWTAGAQGMLGKHLAIGDRLRTSAFGAVLRLAHSRPIALERNTELEIKTMEWQQFSSGVAVGAIGLFVISGTVSYLEDGVEVRAGQQESLVVPAPISLGEEESELEALRRQLEKSEEERARLRKLAERQRLTAPSTPSLAKASAPEIDKTPTSSPARFRQAALNERLDRVNWQAAGTALREVVGFLGEEAARIGEADEVPLDATAAFRKLQGNLLLELSEALEAEDPSLFSHPVIAANLLAGFLDGSGNPIDDAQSDRIAQISSFYAAADERRRAAYEAGTPRLTQLLDELTLKDRFFGETMAVLDARQRSRVTNRAIRGLTGLEPFSSNVILSSVVRTVIFRDRADLATAMTAILGRKITLSPEQQNELRVQVSRWVFGLPEADLGLRGSGLTQLNALPAERVRSQARAQLKLFERLRRPLALTAEQAQTLVGIGEIYVPVRR